MIRFHQHIHPGVHHGSHLIVIIRRRRLAYRFPVADNHPPETHLILQQVDIPFVLMHLYAVERRKTDHDCLYAGINLRLVDRKQFLNLLFG